MRGQELFDAAWLKRTYTQEWDPQTRRQAAAYTPRATGRLRDLRPIPDSLQREFLNFQSQAPAPRELLEVTAFGLRDYVTIETMRRLPDVIAAARIEYARAELQQAMYVPAILHQTGQDSGHDSLAYHARCKARGWDDADVIAANPMSYFDSPSVNFVDWVGRLDDSETDKSAYLLRKPCKLLDEPPEEGVLEAALVVSWIDTALCEPENALTLIGHAMELFGYIRWWHGWEAHQLHAKDDRHLSAKKAADARHEANRQLRQRAVELYRAGNYPSKDAAAFALAGKSIPLSVRTIRDALKGQ